MDDNTLRDYFKRIGYTGGYNPVLETLQLLHEHHVQAIPFENLNSFSGLPVKLDLESLIQKLLYEERGGYCYEQNLLFWEILKTLGFQVKGLEARVLSDTSEENILPRTHMLLLVKLKSIFYTTDVGFGGLNPAIPLMLEPDIIQKGPHEDYRFLYKESNYALQVNIQNKWKPLYSFDLQEQFPSDYEVPNWYISCNPASKFVKDLMASRRAPTCRYTLNNNKFTIYHYGKDIEKHILSTVPQLKEILIDTFGLTLSTLAGLTLK
ncbi:MAG: arylamine N-acetyltransferase family protein, partial [Chitinophagaceae bacterium]